MSDSKNLKWHAFKAAFPNTIPVMAGYLFLGMSYGIYMSVEGFQWYYPAFMALVIYGGSLEFVCVEMLLSAYAPLQTFLMAFMIQARHIFYGLAMLEKYNNTGKKKFYLIFAMSDETFAVNSGISIPDDVDHGWYYFFVSLLDQAYWVLGASIGGIIGSLITFNTDGLSFVMTAMFIVILTDAIIKEKQHDSTIIGLLTSILCLVLFGADNFIIPTMVCILVLLLIFQKPIETKEGVL